MSQHDTVSCVLYFAIKRKVSVGSKSLRPHQKSVLFCFSLKTGNKQKFEMYKTTKKRVHFQGVEYLILLIQVSIWMQGNLWYWPSYLLFTKCLIPSTEAQVQMTLWWIWFKNGSSLCQRECTQSLKQKRGCSKYLKPLKFTFQKFLFTQVVVKNTTQFNSTKLLH